MKLARWLLLILILALILASIASCVDPRGGNGTRTSQPLLSDDITATFGAQLFREQLTAMWISQSTPQPP